MGDATSGPVRLSFNPQLRVEFRGATVTSDAGVLLPRELDERLRLCTLIDRHRTDPRTGHNRQCPLPDLFRQSIYSRLAAYEDTNDAERLAEDPTFRMLASRERRETSVALTSTLQWFETEVLGDERNYQGLSRLNAELVQREASGTRRVTLDIDSSESPGTDRGRPRRRGLCSPGPVRGVGTTGCGVCHPPPGQRCLGAGHRGPAHPATRPTEPRPAGALPELSVSGRVLRPAAAGDRQGRASPGRTLSSGGLHRHHLDRGEPGRRSLLQPARDGGAVDQGRESGHPLDAPLLSSVPGQRGPAALGRHRLQPRQSSAPARPAGRHPELVPDEPPAAAVQDRRAAHPPCAVLHPPACRKPLSLFNKNVPLTGK